MLLSYRALDVEQIGHVYEGLLDHTAIRLSDTALALRGKHEPEMALGQLDGWAADGDDSLIDRLAKETGKSASAVRKALEAPLADEHRARLRAACGNDDDLLERVAPYHALLRDDLRGDPLVFLAGALFVTQALDRRSSGTYYTPRQLAEEVVQHALDPIAYAPGPAQESDPAKWKLKTADELLDLKVADIAMGSGAFLVAACRYLAARLQEAWIADDAPIEMDVAETTKALRDPLPADPIERDALAHRLVAERCLYGVDKNPMAVEMAKLSLWLITLAKDRPFSFVDHALRSGDSLVGIVDVAQLRAAHLDPHWRQGSLDLGFEEIDAAVLRALALRNDLEAFVVRDIPDADRKARLLADADAALADARLLGDLVVGAGLAQRDDADPLAATTVARNMRVVLDHGADAADRAAARTQLRDLADDWLVERRRAIGEVAEVTWADRDPFHWALEFPEVRAQHGFDAIVGNPPFQGGQKITGALGGHYRDYIVTWLADGARGSADLVAYFYLRASRLLRASGGLGLIATNTLSQGDTREVGLDQLVAAGWTLHRAVSSEPWPGGASLEMATVWASHNDWAGTTVLDRREVVGITPALEVRGRVEGKAQRLRGNGDRSFIGSYVLGMGFVLMPEEARAMLAGDPRNADVVRPYLGGEDLNSRPDCSPPRWVIDFRDWPEERAREYAAPFARVAARVRPERAKNNREVYRTRWWQFGERRPALYPAIKSLERSIAITLVSKTVQPALVSTGIVFSHKLAIFAYDDDAHFALLSSGVHWWWTVTRTSTMRTDINYSPSDCFETLVQPSLTERVGHAGNQLNDHRGALMLDRQEGLTKTYNRLHDPRDVADDVARLRSIHVEVDHAVCEAYGWIDLDLAHDFHDTKFGTRFTLAPRPRQEVIDRLLELNHERHSEEVRLGLHGKTKAKARPRAAQAGALTFDV